MSIVITKKCFSCGKTIKVECDETEYRKWQEGTLLQRAMISLSRMEREALLSGMCFDCQEEFYNEPKPGNEKLFGARLGSCSCCDRPVWEKDIKPDGTFQCSSCYETEYC